MVEATRMATDPPATPAQARSLYRPIALPPRSRARTLRADCHPHNLAAARLGPHALICEACFQTSDNARLPAAWLPLTRAEAEEPQGVDSLMGHKRPLGGA